VFVCVWFGSLFVCLCVCVFVCLLVCVCVCFVFMFIGFGLSPFIIYLFVWYRAMRKGD
jgi:hypothetical protein